MTRSRIVFDRAANSTPHDLDGHLTRWQTFGVCPVPVEGARWPARQWGATQATSGGWNARDVANVFHGTRGLTARILATPDYAAAEGSYLSLLIRGQAGPLASQQWAYGLLMTVRSASIEWFHVDAGGWISLGQGGRPPQGTPLFLSYVLEGERASLYVDGQLAGSASIAPVRYTSDVPISLGHRYHVDNGSQLRWRGQIEYVELDDQAATAECERHRFQALCTGVELAADTVRALAPLSGPNYERYRIRPLADRIAAIEAACTRLEESATPPRAYGAMLAQWERALDVRPQPGASLAERQEAVWQAAQAPVGHRPADIAEYAGNLFGVPADEIAIIEPTSWFSVPTRIDPGDPTDTGDPSGWITRGDVRRTAEGLRVAHAAGAPLGDRTYAYAAIDHDEAQGRQRTVFACQLIAAENSRPDHRAALFLARGATITHWITIADASGSGLWSAQLVTTSTNSTAPVETMITPLASARCSLALDWLDGQEGLVIRVSETDHTAEHRLAMPRADRIGFGVYGRGATIPTADVAAVWSDVELLVADSGIGYQAHVYHPAPTIRRPLQHTELLTAHGRATCRITATHSSALRCDDPNSQLDLTPLPRFSGR